MNEKIYADDISYWKMGELVKKENAQKGIRVEDIRKRMKEGREEMNKKVTDLEKFVLDHIYRPFQSMLPDLVDEKLTRNHNLNNSVSYLEAYPEWRKCVLGRCFAIGFRFPDYIVHPLVDYIKKEGRNE